MRRVMTLVAGLLCAATAGAQEGGPGGFVLPEVRWANGIAGAGGQLFVAGGNEGLIALAPGQAPRRLTGPRAAIAVAAREGAVVVADRDRTLHLFRGEAWTRGPRAPEGRFGDDIEAVAFTAEGGVWALSRYGGAHFWDGRRPRLRTVALEGEAKHLAVAGERVFVTGRDRMLVEIRDGRATRPGFADAAEQALARDYQTFGALWVSPASGHLWIGTNGRRVLEVDLEADRVRVHDLPVFGQIGAIAGASVDGAEWVVVGAQSELVLLRGGAVVALPGRFSFPEGLAVHAPSRHLFVANRDGVQAVDLEAGRVVDAPTVAARAASTTTAPTSGGGDEGAAASAMASSAGGGGRGGLRVENMNVSGCGLIPAMAIAARAQEAAGRCVPAGGSVRISLQTRGGRARRVEVEVDGRPQQCARRRLRALRVPAAPRCDATFTLAR